MVIHGAIKDKFGLIESATICYSIGELITFFREHGLEPEEMEVQWDMEGAWIQREHE